MNSGEFLTQAGTFPIQFDLENDILRGRIGGTLQGQNFELQLRDDGMSGHLAKKTIELQIQEGELVGHIGESPISLRGVENIQGKLGQTLLAISLNAKKINNHLVGNLGNQSFTLQLNETPAWLAALVACLAHESLH